MLPSMNRRAIALASVAIAFIAMTASAHAQRREPAGETGPTGTISGTVIDGVSGTALARATIALRNGGDSLLVTGAIAERDGSFAISGIRPGGYYARVSFVGYSPRLIDVALGRIVLLPDSSLHNEVTVSARRQFMTQAIDRTIYKTADLLVTDGGSAIDPEQTNRVEERGQRLHGSRWRGGGDGAEPARKG
ncbi:MAG: hypothetical protein JWQ98_580 [Chlorobi bacterium]|nr:hypothetical protein [Chlorobiota bacterium]